MKGLKIVFKYEFAEGLISIIDKLCTQPLTADDDKMVVAALLEVKERLCTRMARIKEQYTITLSPVQALGLRILHTDFTVNTSAYMAAKMLSIANQVEQTYTT